MYRRAVVVVFALLVSSIVSLPASAAEQDSLRYVLRSSALSVATRVAVLERLVLLSMESEPDTALVYAWQLYDVAQNNSTNKQIRAAALTALINGYIYADKPENLPHYYTVYLVFRFKKNLSKYR